MEQDRGYISAVVLAQRHPECASKKGVSVRISRLGWRGWWTHFRDGFTRLIVSVAHVRTDRERLLYKAGQPMPVEKANIAATARRHGLTIASNNDRDFRSA